MTGQQAFGDVVAEARAILGMSPAGAAAMLDMTESLLEDIENGLIEMNPALQEIFENAYEIDLRNTPPTRAGAAVRRPITYDEEAGILRIDNLGVRFRVGIDDNDVLLRGFSSAVRRLRRLSPGVPLRLRAADMPMLARLIDLDDEDLDARAQFWFGQDSENAQSFSTLMRLSRPPKVTEF